MVFAITIIRLKEKYPELLLECAIPCNNHPSQWNEKDKKLYHHILKLSNKVTYVSSEEYKPYLMQKRNEYMVDKCDILLAIWDGSFGGTKNCVEYAKKLNKKIIIISPNSI